MKIGGRLFHGLQIGVGIKQGCPSSGSLFALALDPFLRYLLNRIPPPRLEVRAFADDLGAILRGFKYRFGTPAAAFGLLKLAACLEIHPAKTQLCMILNPKNEDIGEFLPRVKGEWSDVKIVDAILYLGAMVGPGADLVYWDTTIAKFKSAAKALAEMNMATPSALRWFAVAVQSIPSYVASLQPPSVAMSMAEQIAISSIVNIPHQSIPMSTFNTLHHLNFPIHINNIKYYSLAARCRVYMASPLMPRLLDEIETKIVLDDSYHIYPHKH